MDLVKLLQRGRGYVTAVGDDAQSIYGFRGASAEAFHAFRQAFAEHGLQECILQRNYRSRPSILAVRVAIVAHSGSFENVQRSLCVQVAHHMLRQCKTLTKKKLYTGKEEGEPVALWELGAGGSMHG